MSILSRNRIYRMQIWSTIYTHGTGNTSRARYPYNKICTNIDIAIYFRIQIARQDDEYKMQGLYGSLDIRSKFIRNYDRTKIIMASDRAFSSRKAVIDPIHMTT